MNPSRREPRGNTGGVGRVPPCSEEAERGVLGSALIDPGRVLDLCIERGLDQDAFYLKHHQAVYDVLLEMHRESRAIDLLTVEQYLKDHGKLDALGGGAFLETLEDSTPTPAHAEYYIQIVAEKHLLRKIIACSQEAIDQCYAPERDAAEVLGTAEQAIFEVSAARRGDWGRAWPEMVNQVMKDIEVIFQTRKPATGMSSGYVGIDERLGGFKGGEMIILAARPSQGKTSLALNIAENVATVSKQDPQARPVAVFSLEMSSEQLVQRMLFARARVPAHRLMSGFISEVNHADLAQAASALMKAPIIIDDSAGLEALEVRSRARRLMRKYNIELVIIDYLQLLNYSMYARDGRQRETAAISGALKAMAKELNVPVLVLSQLSRAPETRDRLAVPKLSDLRDSGSIEQDADVVLMLRRPCKYPGDEHEHDKTLAVVDVAKNRNGPTGFVHLNFFEEYTRFDNRAQGVDAEHERFPADEGRPA